MPFLSVVDVVHKQALASGWSQEHYSAVRTRTRREVLAQMFNASASARCYAVGLSMWMEMLIPDHPFPFTNPIIDDLKSQQDKINKLADDCREKEKEIKSLHVLNASQTQSIAALLENVEYLKQSNGCQNAQQARDSYEAVQASALNGRETAIERPAKDEEELPETNAEPEKLFTTSKQLMSQVSALKAQHAADMLAQEDRHGKEILALKTQHNSEINDAQEQVTKSINIRYDLNNHIAGQDKTISKLIESLDDKETIILSLKKEKEEFGDRLARTEALLHETIDNGGSNAEQERAKDIAGENSSSDTVDIESRYEKEILALKTEQNTQINEHQQQVAALNKNILDLKHEMTMLRATLTEQEESIDDQAAVIALLETDNASLNDRLVTTEATAQQKLTKDAKISGLKSTIDTLLSTKKSQAEIRECDEAEQKRCTKALFENLGHDSSRRALMETERSVRKVKEEDIQEERCSQAKQPHQAEISSDTGEIDESDLSESEVEAILTQLENLRHSKEADEERIRMEDEVGQRLGEKEARKTPKPIIQVGKVSGMKHFWEKVW